MYVFNQSLFHSFNSRQVVKVIAGLNNNNIYQILKLIKAIELSNATYIDIIANPKIVMILKAMTDLPICVSSINPIELYNCVLAGADIVELGNFDVFYDKEIKFSAKNILDLAIETRHLIPFKDICVTIPYHLSLYEQIGLSQKLEKNGINFLQTEGGIVLAGSPLDQKADCIFASTYIASASLSSTYAISHAVNIPVISASGINCLSAPIALSYGASGIGIGRMINQLVDINIMSNYIDEIKYSLSSKTNYIINNLEILNILDTQLEMITHKHLLKSF
uniref:Uncharacterized protein ycf23 n=1 Tax=Bornetia secundiflora TaxID=2575637 RepID=A0A4D6WQE3_9FLOR|nr:hypothetical protein [Bornetia secundiflora]